MARCCSTSGAGGCACTITAGTNTEVTGIGTQQSPYVITSLGGGGGTGVTDPEIVRDTIAASLVAGSNVTITSNDTANTITIASSGGGTTDPEVVRDTMAGALIAGSNVTITPDDTANTITIASSGAGTLADGSVTEVKISTALLRTIEALLRWDGTGTQPLRTSVTADSLRPVRWRQPVAPPTTAGYAITGLDVWDQTP